MHKFRLFLLCSFLAVCLVSGALAQSVSCPEAHLVLSVPDPWTVVPLSPADDPDLRLLLEGNDLTLAVYVTDVGGVLPDSFEVWLGNETDSGTDMRSGKKMDYVAGTAVEGDYRIYLAGPAQPGAAVFPDLRAAQGRLGNHPADHGLHRVSLISLFAMTAVPPGTAFSFLGTDG